MEQPSWSGGERYILHAINSQKLTLNDARNITRGPLKGWRETRMGFLLETLKLGDSEALRKAVSIAPGFLPLDPTLPKRRKYNRCWGLLVNVEIKG